MNAKRNGAATAGDGHRAGRPEDIALHLDDVVKTFGPKTAVNHLSFTALRGEILTLLGPNGAGKTTTIEMCEGFTQPSSGHLNVLGLNPRTDAERIRERIGIMLQDGGSYSGIRVKEMLELTASYNANPLDPSWLMDVLGLTNLATTTYRRLSGGQQQRLSLALALIGRPELVFLDEPTAGMDAQSRRAVWSLIQALKRDGVTVILTTHLMDEAESLADYVVIIDHGAVVAQGTPQELTETKSATVLEFRTAAPFDTTATFPHAGHPLRIAETETLVYRVNAAPDPGLIAAITAEAARQNVLIKELGVLHNTLEDVFLDITGHELRS